MTDDAKRKTLACLLGVVILTVLIAAALPQLELKPGVPLPGQADSSGGALPEQSLPALSISISTLWKAILGILLLVGLIYYGYRMLRGIIWNWREVLSALPYLIIPPLIVVGVLLALSGVHFTSAPAEAEVPPPVLDVKGPPLGPLPPGLIWLVCLGLAATLVGLGLWLTFRPAARPGSDQLTLEAERALQALKTGLDLNNVILQCYWQMGRVLKQEQGIEMEAAMTAREFEHLLEARGVPHPPVHQLTQLFEAARYGHRPPRADDERRAVDSLTAIVQYSQAGRQSH